YLDHAAEAKEARGLSAAEARRTAAAEMGGLEAVKEGVRAVRAGAGLESLLRDLLQAVRQLRRAPGLSAAVIRTPALAIGANAAVFSVVEAVLLAPLPYRDADRLMWIWSNLDKAGYRRGPLSGPELVDLREGARTFEGFAAIWATGAQLTGDGEPEQLRIGLGTSNFFALLRAAPRTGPGLADR